MWRPGRIVAWVSRPAVVQRLLLASGLLLLGLNTLCLILSYTSLPARFAYLFRAQDPPAHSDAIVMMLGGPFDRPARVAELYRQGLAPVILLGSTATTVSYNESDFHRRALLAHGVPDDAIRVLPGEVVESTHDEALRVRDYVRSHPARRITVVTTAYHTARTRWTFRRVLRGSGVDVRMDATEHPRFTESDWFDRSEGFKEYMKELAKIILYRIIY